MKRLVEGGKALWRVYGSRVILEERLGYKRSFADRKREVVGFEKGGGEGEKEEGRKVGSKT